MNYNKTLSNRYKTVMDSGSDFTLKAIDCTRYTRRVTTNPRIKGFSRLNLSTFLKVKKINKSKINKKNLLLIMSFLLITQGNTSAHAATSSDYYKLYIHSKIIDFKQYKCAIEIGDRESHWNPTAVNGNHYGIFQMNNKKVKYMNPFTQIDWWIKYIKNRYHGSYCTALEHLKKRGWQ